MVKSMIQKIGNYISGQGILQGVGTIILKVMYRLFAECYRFYIAVRYPVDKNAIVFSSSIDFSDNARALSDYMEKNVQYEKYKIYWIVNDVDKCKKRYGGTRVRFIPGKVSRIREVPLSTLKIHMSSKYIMATHNFVVPKAKGRKEQIYVRLWHGCGYKDSETRYDGKKALFDIAVVPGNLFVGTKAKFWNVSKDRLLPIGQPRYDWMLSPSRKAYEYADTFRKKGEKIVIWMPTFRNTAHKNFPEESIKEFPLLHSQADWENVNRWCTNYNIKLLIKLHNLQLEYDIDFFAYSQISKITDQDLMQEGIFLYEFLATTDALISDYSSVAIDYLLLDKPIAFVLEDYEMYRDSRGFVFEDPREYMPGHHIYTGEQFNVFLNDLDKGNDLYRELRQKICEQAICKTDNYCMEVLKYLEI